MHFISHGVSLISIRNSCLRNVINVGSLPHWDRLFNFTAALRQPFRGGRRINFAARILAQLE